MIFNHSYRRSPDKLELAEQVLGGVSLTGGQLGGLSNMVRTDTALLDKR